MNDSQFRLLLEQLHIIEGLLECIADTKPAPMTVTLGHTPMTDIQIAEILVNAQRSSRVAD